MDTTPVLPARLVLARATVNLPGFHVGTVKLVDASDPDVADLVDHDFLALVGVPSDDAPAPEPSYAVE